MIQDGELLLARNERGIAPGQLFRALRKTKTDFPQVLQKLSFPVSGILLHIRDSLTAGWVLVKHYEVGAIHRPRVLNGLGL